MLVRGHFFMLVDTIPNTGAQTPLEGRPRLRYRLLPTNALDGERSKLRTTREKQPVDHGIRWLVERKVVNELRNTHRMAAASADDRQFGLWIPGFRHAKHYLVLAEPTNGSRPR